MSNKLYQLERALHLLPHDFAAVDVGAVIILLNGKSAVCEQSYDLSSSRFRNYVGCFKGKGKGKVSNLQVVRQSGGQSGSQAVMWPY